VSLLKLERNYDSFFKVKLATKKEATRVAYHYSLSDFEKYCSNTLDCTLEEAITLLKHADPEDIIDNLQNYINQNNTSSSNIRGRVCQINGYLYYRGIKIDERDMKDLEYKNEASEPRQPIRTEELRDVLDKVKTINKALYCTLSSSGMTIGEACHVKKSDFDNSQTRLLIKLKPEYTKKDSRPRNLFISKEAEKILKPFLDKLEPDELVFTNNADHRQAVLTAQQNLRRVVDSLGFGVKYSSGVRHITLHAMRAYFFSKATARHGIGYAHNVCGHRGYMEMYNRYTPEQMLEMYLDLEPDLLIDDTERLKAEKAELVAKISEIDNLKLEMEKIKQRLGVSENLNS